MTCFVHALPATDAPWVYGIEFDFNQAMVDGIKRRIPSRARSWKPELKQWWVKADVMDDVLSLAIIHCGRVVHVESLEEEAPVTAFATLHLLPSAPDEVVKVVYRTMCKLNHPDKGGDTAKMQKINRAYELLQRN